MYGLTLNKTNVADGSKLPVLYTPAFQIQHDAKFGVPHMYNFKTYQYNITCIQMYIHVIHV